MLHRDKEKSRFYENTFFDYYHYYYTLHEKIMSLSKYVLVPCIS